MKLRHNRKSIQTSVWSGRGSVLQLPV